jgi:tetraacyldisaccharide 4'-kinase
MALSWIYSKITGLRNLLYEKKVFKSYRLDALTISIGNLTVGGTGKTPLTVFVAEVLAEKGEKVCIISRGYKRKNPQQRVVVSDGKKILTNVENAGDEPFEIAHRLLGKAAVIADANRMAAAIWARQNLEASVFVLDDAFQHRRIRRDLDVVLIDATNPFGNGKTLPFGILREPLKNLRRADLIIISRADLASKSQVAALKSQISEITDCPVFAAGNKISNLVKLKDFQSQLQNYTPKVRMSLLKNAACLAFCGLGNPNNFFGQLRQENFNLITTVTFPDHHFYNLNDLKNLEKQAQKSNAEVLLTTAKDAVKLSGFQLSMPCYVVENKLVFDDEKHLRQIFQSVSRQLV